MEGMHVLLFVEFTKDFKKSSMISQKISRELFDHGHAVSIVDIEAMEYMLDNNNNHTDEDNNCNNIKQLVNPDVITAEEIAADCDAMLFISPKHWPILPKCLSGVLNTNESMVLSRWYLQGVSCFLIAKKMKISVAQFLWKTLRKFESNSLQDALGPWRRYEWEKQSCMQETALPSI